MERASELAARVALVLRGRNQILGAPLLAFFARGGCMHRSHSRFPYTYRHQLPRSIALDPWLGPAASKNRLRM
jgi:hypothetical protein